MIDTVAIAETREWMAKRGFRPVLCPLTGQYAEDFDRLRNYQFMRSTWDEPSVFCLADAHPLLNISGLQFRTYPVD